MKKLLIYCFIISPFWLLAQQEILKENSQKKGILIAVDLLNPALSIFSDKKGAEALVTVPWKKKWDIAGEIGYEQNSYDDNIWDVDVSGVYTRLGANWFISQDIKNPNLGYYIGGRFAYSPYQQTIIKYTIQGTDLPTVTGSLPEHSAHTLWLEPLVGGRVNIGASNFYIDASARLKIKLWDSNEHDLDSFIIPGFGTNNNGLNFGLNWSVGYILPL